MNQHTRCGNLQCVCYWVFVLVHLLEEKVTGDDVVGIPVIGDSVLGAAVMLSLIHI